MLPSDARPEVLSLFTASFIIGLQLSATFPGIGGWMFLFLGVGFFVFGFLAPLRGWLGWLPLVLAGISVGALIHAARVEERIPPEALLRLHHHGGSIQGVFTGEFKFLKRGGLSFSMEETEFFVASQVVHVPGQVRCEVRSMDLLPEPGQRYAASGTMQVFKGRRRPSFITEEVVPAPNSGLINPMAGSIQRWIRDGTSSLLSQRHQAFMIGFLIGDTSALDRRDRGLFRQTGLTHLLAVSGQHIMIFALIIVSILVWAGIPPISRCLLTVLCLIGFGFVTGGQPSVWRAIVMYVSAVFILHAEASPGPIRPVAFAALVLLLFRPEWVNHLGFQFSFLAVLGILLGQPPMEILLRRLGLPEILARYLAVSFAANIATIPLSAYYFGYIPLVSFLVNPLVVWSFELILPMGIALAFFGHAWFSVGIILASGLSLLLDTFLIIVQGCSMLPLATIDLFAMPGFFTAGIYGFMLAGLGWVSSPQFLEKFGKKAKAHKKPHPEKPKGSPPKDPTLVKTPSLTGKPAWDNLRPLRDQELLEAIDSQMSRFPKRSLKSKGNFELVSFPVRKLSVENQTLFNRLDDLSREVLRGEPDRLLQAQVFSMAFLAGEILNKVCPRLVPSPAPGELSGSFRVRNRYLATVLAADTFFDSKLPARTADPFLMGYIKRAQHLHHQGHLLLARYFKERALGGVADQFSHRQAVFQWSRELIQWIEGNPAA